MTRNKSIRNIKKYLKMSNTSQIMKCSCQMHIYVYEMTHGKSKSKHCGIVGVANLGFLSC